MTNREKLLILRDRTAALLDSKSGDMDIRDVVSWLIAVLLGPDAAPLGEKPALKVGERVRLASGGPEMTVIADGNTLETKITSTSGGCSIVRVAWWAGDGSSNELREKLLPAAALSRTEDRLKQIDQQHAHREMLVRAHHALVDIRVSKDRQDVDHDAVAARARAAEDELAGELFG